MASWLRLFQQTTMAVNEAEIAGGQLYRETLDGARAEAVGTPAAGGSLPQLHQAHTALPSLPLTRLTSHAPLQAMTSRTSSSTT